MAKKSELARAGLIIEVYQPLVVKLNVVVGGYKGTMLDGNNRNLKSSSIHCNAHDNPLIEPGEMQYYAKIEGTDRSSTHPSRPG